MEAERFRIATGQKLAVNGPAGHPADGGTGKPLPCMCEVNVKGNLYCTFKVAVVVRVSEPA